MNTKFVLLAKKEFSHILEDMNSKTFHLLRTIRETSECHLPTPPPTSFIQSLSFVCTYACNV